MKKIKTFILICTFPFLCVSVVSAHQPNLVGGENVVVEDPEISRAFYGELEGGEVYYEIESEESFRLYVGILVPDIEGVQKNVSALITKEGDEDFEILLDGENFDWTEYYEEHAGDNYFSGPYFSEKDADQSHPKGVEVDGGKYVIKVSNPTNQGKYVLVIGDTESFPLREIVRTVGVMPGLKKYFEKSVLQSFTTLTMIGFLTISILVVAGVILLIWWILRLIRRHLS